MLNKALEDSMNLGMPDDPNEDEFEVEDTNVVHSMNMNTLSSHGQDSVFSGNQSSVMDINESNDSFLDASEGASGSDDDVDMMSG